MKKIVEALLLFTLAASVLPAFAVNEETEELFDTHYQEEIVLEKVEAMKLSIRENEKEEVTDDEATDNAETNFEFFSLFDKNNDDKVD